MHAAFNCLFLHVEHHKLHGVSCMTLRWNIFVPIFSLRDTTFFTIYLSQFVKMLNCSWYNIMPLRGKM